MSARRRQRLRSLALNPDGSPYEVVAGRECASDGWEVDPQVWAQHACDGAGDLTPEQWAEVVPEQDYVSVCPAG